MDNPAFRLRATYRKSGRLAMLSHLEVAHALERAVRRAKLPFAVTHGFSPHMKIAFGSALPVGVGGLAEIFDVHLLRYVPPAEALSALAAASVDDLGVYDCAYIGAKDLAASVAFPISTYVARFDGRPRIELPETVTVVRKGKEKVLVVSDFLLEGPDAAEDAVAFTLRSLPTGSLRPDAFARALVAHDDGRRIVNLTRVSQKGL